MKKLVVPLFQTLGERTFLWNIFSIAKEADRVNESQAPYVVCWEGKQENEMPGKITETGLS